MQNSDMYHNCSSPCELSIRNLNVIARLNPNSSLREAYYFGGVVSPAFKSHTSIAAMIYLVFNVFNITACVYINSPSPSSSDKTLVNHRAILGPSLCLCSYPCLFSSSLPSSTQMPEWASQNTRLPEPCLAQEPWLTPHPQHLLCATLSQVIWFHPYDILLCSTSARTLSCRHSK